MYRKNGVSVAFLKKRHEKSISLLDGVSPERILDIGCDDGHFLSALAEKYPKAELVGCDMNAETLKHAAKACPKARLVHGNFMELDFEKTDLALFLEVLEHAEDPKKMLMKAKGLLRKGGHVLISIPRPELLRWRVMWKLWSSTFGRRWHGEHTEMTEKDLIDLAGSCGLGLRKKTRFFFDCVSIMLFRLEK